MFPLAKRKSNMTETTASLSEVGENPSLSFRVENADLTPPATSLSLDDDRSDSRIHQIRAHARMSAPEIDPSSIRRNSSRSSSSSAPSLSLDDDRSQYRIHRIRANKRLSAPEIDHSALPTRKSSRRSSSSSMPPLSVDDVGSPSRIHRIQANKRMSHRIQANKRMSAPVLRPPSEDFGFLGLDSMPSVPKRRNSHASMGSGIRDEPAPPRIQENPEEEDTVLEDKIVLSPTSPVMDRAQSDLSTRPPTEKTDLDPPSGSERRFTDDADEPDDAMPIPVRKGSSHLVSILSETSHEDTASESQVASESQNGRSSGGSSSMDTEEAIRNMILSQIPEHIRNQMTPEMWKQIFTVNAIKQQPGAASVCSELTDDILSPTPNQRHSVDHTGMVERISSDGNNEDFVKENFESHSTFRSLVTDDSTFVTDDSKSTKGADVSIATISPEPSPLAKRQVVDLAPKSTTKVPRKRTKRPGSRRSQDWHESRGDAPPSVPVKKASIRSIRGVDSVVDSIEDTTSIEEEHRLPKRRQYSVRFDPKAEVRNYERILEVHPATSSGPSVGIGWKFAESSAEVSWYPSHNKGRDMLLSRQARERIVRVELGYTPREIAKAIRENLKIKNQRRRTVNNLQEYGSFAPVEKVEYLLEKCQRKLGRLVGRKSASKNDLRIKELSAASESTASDAE